MSDLDDRRRADAAEKTVSVLKKKVLELYNGGSQSALQRQLEKARHREEENRRKRELIEVRANELSRYNATLEAEVRRRTQAIKTILDNVTFGFLVIDRDLRVLPESTRSCTTLFERDAVEGASLPELLELDARRREHLVLGVDQVFEDVMPSEVSLAQLQQKFPKKSGKVLSAEGSVVRGEDGNVSGILFTVSDISALEAATREGQVHRTLVSILRQREAFRAFLYDTRKLLGSSRECIAREEQLAARRYVHTVKGNAASYGLTDLVDVIHDIEESPALDRSQIDAIEASLRAFLATHAGVLELEYDGAGTEGFEVSEAQLSGLRTLLSKGASVDELRRWADRVAQKPAWQVLGPVKDFAARLGERLSKQVDFELEGADVLVDVELVRPVFQSLTHLLRNAIDHGIERPLERGKKAASGRLTMWVEERPDGYTVGVRDDGRGIDVEKLSRRAVEKGFLPRDRVERMSEEERVALIFVDGLSSADVTTTISGRGIGMSAVKEALDRVGGKIDVRTASGEGTTFVLSIPRLSAEAI
jgi:two-component system, chemotaxis family, sensor kinase CheA